MIDIKNLEFSYSAKHPVLDGINFQLEEGKIYGLLGENGVGKSTLLKLVAGLLKPKSGSCDVDTHNPFSREPSFLREIYFIPEDFVGPHISVEKYAKSIGAFYPNFKLDFFYDLMTTFGVDPTASFKKLSFGQQKKSILSVAISLRTKYLLLDEPSNGLDIPSKAQLRKVISQSADENTTIIISTHQVRDLENLIDPIIILDRKDVLLNASIEEISEKLYFSLDSTKNENAFYSEQVLGGYMQVVKNENGKESKVNLESLFNAMLSNKEEIKKLFKS